ncbi:FkbM family methyltransferase [Methylobacterium sp. WL7]|uniref:FkbM family methyltransferase n=1 Tax=Methylobacterium sp. WL7 TaxID=2603900 RepID=UPI0011C89C91|nr:FkbM family methyltransferase [Methylobacterium sp. WL7]TXN44748.1 FkbM family methyltransferase [Methylobacterium sp. WL7]
MRTKKEALSLIAERGFNASLIVDVGVATGTDGLYEVWPDAHYVLVEALPKFKDDLERIASGLRSCQIFNAFAGRAPGTADIATAPDQPHVHWPADIAPPGWPRDSIPIVTVDSLVSPRLTISPATQAILKIDVDGAEIDVLEGARATLTCDCVVVIEAALLDERTARFGRIINFMTAHGYEAWDILEPVLRPNDNLLWQVDLVFVPRDSALRASRAYQ